MSLLTMIMQPFWHTLYYCVEIWFFRMPLILGGNENLDRGQICANLLKRPLYEITEELRLSTCESMFKEKINSYCWVVLALWFGFSIYQLYLVLYTIIIGRFGKSQTITIINEVNKRKHYDTPTRRTEDATERRKATEAINKETKRLLQAICDVITFEANDTNKIDAIKKFITNANPSLNRDITCNLIGTNYNSIQTLKNQDEEQLKIE